MNNQTESSCENCIIRQLNSLKTLGKRELKLISDSKVTKSFKKGETIFKEGKKLNGVFCIRNGITKLSKKSDNGKDQIVKIVTKGELLGQRSVISNEATNLDAVALCDMEVCFISKKHLNENISNNIEFTKSMLIHIASDLKFSNNAIVNMAQKTVKQRIAATLRYLENNFEVDCEGYITTILNREDIANIVGTAKETCIRTLSSFKKKGWIAIDGKRIRIEDDNALCRLADGF